MSFNHQEHVKGMRESSLALLHRSITLLVLFLLPAAYGIYLLVSAASPFIMALGVVLIVLAAIGTWYMVSSIRAIRKLLSTLRSIDTER